MEVQIKYSLGILQKIWDMLTLHNWHWLVVGLFVASCMLPNFGSVALVLGIASVGLLASAYLREGRAIDREK